MGTRHQQTVIDKEGERKISQYGQWDGYPDGQGKDILDFLRTGNLAKYQEELSKIRQVSDTEIATVNSTKNWQEEYPYMSRDCGSRIHKLIEKGKVKFVRFIEDEEAAKWCKGFYTINFKTNEFISEYYNTRKAFSLDNLPTEEEYLKEMTEEE
jgi:hypothetical protein